MADKKRRKLDELADIIDGLSAYDMVREPRKLVNDPDAIEVVEMKRLLQEFKCPICLGVLQKTVTVMQCLHRFCSNCMQRNLRSMSKKQCPACRIHVPSRRSLQPDFRIDAIIAKIIPDIDKFERYRQKCMRKAVVSQNESAGVNKTWTKMLQQQKAVRRKHVNVRHPPPATTGAVTSPRRVIPTSTSPGPDTRVRVVFCRHKSSSMRRFTPMGVLVPGTCTVEVLKLYIAKRIYATSSSYSARGSQLELLWSQQSKRLVLDDKTTIDTIIAALTNRPLPVIVLEVCTPHEVSG